MEKTKSSSLGALFLFLFGGGIISAAFQYDVVWDFLNYHYFNAWAFLEGRINYDVAVAGITAFYNPILDIPLYFMINSFNNHPVLIYFLQGLWFGALCYAFFKIVLLFVNAETTRGKINVALCLLIGITGNAVFLQIGTSSNEMISGFLVMAALYLLLREIFIVKSGKSVFFVVSGLLLGLAMGGKLTAFMYCVAAGLSLIIFYKHIRNPLKNIILFALAGLIGFLIFNGYWMWTMWTHFENPFFPFANGIFKSAWLSSENFTDTSFTPKTWYQYLFWPIILSLRLYRDEGNGMFISDMRPMVVYLIFIYWGIKYLYQFIINRKVAIDTKWAFLTVFFLLSYVIWMVVFSISRYYVVIEMLAAIFIVKALFSKIPKSMFGEALYYSFALIMVFILLSTPYFSNMWGRRYSWKALGLPNNAYFLVEKVNIPDNTLFLTYNYPLAGFLAYWGKDVPLRGLNVSQDSFLATLSKNLSVDYFNYHPKWQQAKNKVLAEHKGPVFVLMTKSNLKDGKEFDYSNIEVVKDMYCKDLVNNQRKSVVLCVPKGLEKIVFGH